MGFIRYSARLAHDRDQVLQPSPPPDRVAPEAPYPVRGCHFIIDNGPWLHRSPAWCGRPRASLETVYCEKHYRQCYRVRA